MFNFFKAKCPVCKMKLDRDRSYPEISGQKFCSNGCKDKYQKSMPKADSKDAGGCCH